MSIRPFESPKARNRWSSILRYRAELQGFQTEPDVGRLAASKILKLWPEARGQERHRDEIAGVQYLFTHRKVIDDHILLHVGRSSLPRDATWCGLV